MIVGFDAKRAFYNNRGLGSYSRSVIAGFCKHQSDNCYHLFSSKSGKPLWTPECGSLHLGRNPLPFLWRSFGVSRKLEQQGIQIYHGLSNELPYSTNKSIKWVVTIHDLLYLKRKSDYPYIDRIIYHTKVKYALGRSDLIIAVSDQTRRDVIKYYNIPENKVVVIPPACNDLFFQASDTNDLERVKTRYQLPDRFLLFVGALVPNKNIDILIKALNHLPEQKLVIVGRGSLQKQIEKQLSHYGLTERAFMLSTFIDNKDLSALYQLATHTIVPSFYEGFGIPIVESLASGTPVICSNSTALIETCGPGGRSFDPNKVEDLIDVIKSLAVDSTSYKQVINDGLVHAQSFTSKLTTQLLAESYKQLI